MAEKTLLEQLDALKKASLFGDPFTEVFQKKQKEAKLLSQYKLEDIEQLQEVLGQEMEDPIYFQLALKEMPPKLVTLLAMLAKIDEFELAHTAVSLIFIRQKLGLKEQKNWAQILHQMLNMLLPQWDKTALKNLDQELTKVITEREKYQMRGLETIEAVIEANLWPGLELLYTEHQVSPLSKTHLNKIMLLAAWLGNWSVFMECLELGANVSEAVDAGRGVVGSEKPVSESQSSGNETLMKELKYSILHEAVKHGLDLQQLQLAGGFPEGMVNALDCYGNTLLHMTISDDDKEVGIKNVLFLMTHKADVNIVNKSGMTAVQKLVGRGDFTTSAIDMLVAMVEGADKIESHSWAPVRELSALCLLCASGKYHHVLTAVEKGADVKHLFFKLTLIDMVILQENLPYELKEQTLAVLLNKPISLGAFHASVVAQRPLSEDNMVYKDKEVGPVVASYHAGETYLYPALRLLFPFMYTRVLQRKRVVLVKMMVEGDAVCDAELLALNAHLQQLKDDDVHRAVEYLLPLIEALPPSASASPE